MKLGTVTVHNGYNYGASLQAYGLVKALEDLGYEANLIDYRNPLIEKKMASKKKDSGIKKAIKYLLLNGKGYELRKKRFNEFNASFIEGKTYYSVDELKELNKEYDGFVCGSDQIWNMNITDHDPAFFLSFADKDKIRISYAASLGEEKAESERTKEFFVENLKSLDSISVREVDSVPIIKGLTETPCHTVIDPVLLAEETVWNELAEKSSIKTPKYKYAFYYELFRNDEMYEFALKKAKERGVKLVRTDILPAKALIKGCVSLSDKGIGPAEFVKLIKNAEFVVTNSFHGTVFSILFEKEFYVVPLTGKLAGRNKRIENLLGMISLSDHIVKNGECKYEKADFNEVKKCIEKEKNIAKEYIVNAINEKRDV